MVRVLLIDDDPTFVESLCKALGSDFDITKAFSHEDAWRVFQPFRFDVALVDIRLSDLPTNRMGLEILKEIHERDPDLPVVMMTAYADIEIAVESLKLGAEDFIQKSKTNLAEYRQILTSLFRTGKLKRKVTYLESRLEKFDPWKIVGAHPGIQEIRRQIKVVAEDGNTNVLIRGETGTGKELVARAIHLEGVRKENPYHVIALASLNKDTISSDLFGHERGAYTGAVSQRTGFIEEADGGVIFLDEVADLAAEVQAKLLRVLETKEFTRLGGNRTIKVDVQWVMATNRDLEKMKGDGTLREDLYYRLKAFEIVVPPLSERRADIPLLVEHFLATFNSDLARISDKAMLALTDYYWPGNVRELRQSVQYAILKARLEGAKVIGSQHFPQEIVFETGKPVGSGIGPLPVDVRRELAELELTYVSHALEKTGRKTEAWKLLGYSDRFALRRRVLAIFNKYPELRNSFSIVCRLFLGTSQKRGTT